MFYTDGWTSMWYLTAALQTGLRMVQTVLHFGTHQTIPFWMSHTPENIRTNYIYLLVIFVIKCLWRTCLNQGYGVTVLWESLRNRSKNCSVCPHAETVSNACYEQHRIEEATEQTTIQDYGTQSSSSCSDSSETEILLFCEKWLDDIMEVPQTAF